MEAQQDPRKLFKERKKHVLNPRVPDWKKVLGEVWQAVDTFTSEPRARNMRLPALKGTPRRRKPRGNGHRHHGPERAEPADRTAGRLARHVLDPAHQLTALHPDPSERCCRLGMRLWDTDELIDAREALRSLGTP